MLSVSIAVEVIIPLTTTNYSSMAAKVEAVGSFCSTVVGLQEWRKIARLSALKLKLLRHQHFSKNQDATLRGID